MFDSYLHRQVINKHNNDLDKNIFNEKCSGKQEITKEKIMKTFIKYYSSNKQEIKIQDATK